MKTPALIQPQTSSVPAPTPAPTPNSNIILRGYVPSIGVAHKVKVVGNKAYLACDKCGLVSVDVSNPAVPIILSSSNFNFDALYLDISNNIACLTGSRKYTDSTGQVKSSLGFYTMDISNSNSIQFKGKIEDSFGFLGLCISGNYAYIACNSNGVKIIDISNPSNPVLIGGYQTPGFAKNLTILGRYLYVAHGVQGMTILDIINPINPIFKSTISVGDFASGVFVSGQYAYISASGVMKIVNINNPIAPFIVGSVTPPSNSGGTIVETKVQNNIAYIGSGFGGIFSVDVSNPSAPNLLNQLGPAANSSGTTGVDIMGNYILLADNQTGMRITNNSLLVISNPNGHFKADSITFNLNSQTGVVTGTRLSNTEGNVLGLRIVNLSDPSKPKIVGGIDNLVSYGATIYWNYVFVACGLLGLKVIDISNPSNPTIVTTYDTPGNARGIYFSGNYAYIADGANGLLILNIANPRIPVLVGSINVGDFVSNVFISGYYAYLAGSSRMTIVNIRNPVVPTIISTVSVPTAAGTIVNVMVTGNIAYVASGSGGIFTVNVTNPSSPYIMGVLGMNGTGQATEVNVRGTKAYVAVTSQGLWVVDVSNPSQPSLLYSILGSDEIRGVKAFGNYVYCSDSFGCIDIFQLVDTTVLIPAPISLT
jgi:hypothetical protein